MQNNAKQVDSIHKTFALLNLLLKNNANFVEVVKTISPTADPISIDNSIHSVNLNKYLNTLRLFGLNVKKEKGKYHLINPPYKIELTPTDIKALNNIKECAEKYPTSNNKTFEEFINSFELHFSEKTQMYIQSLETNSNTDFSFYYDKLTNKIDICTKFCNEDFNVEIIYYKTDITKPIKILAGTKELIYRNGSIKLNILNLKTNEHQLIPLDKIIDIKQNPKKNSMNFSNNKTVVYGLKGRLSKNYKLRPWETSSGPRGEWNVIFNKNEPEAELLTRLLKYGDQCVVFTPHDFKNKLQDKIKKTLALYNAI